MIAALVILALAASAPVQAFPGSDPVSELAAVAPQHLDHQLASSQGDLMMCLLPYVSEATILAQQYPNLSKNVTDAVQNLTAKVSACRDSNNDNKFTCVLQAIRDVWEASENSRQELVVFVKRTASLVIVVKDKCFTNPSQRRFLRPDIQTLPRDIQTLPRYIQTLPRHFQTLQGDILN